MSGFSREWLALREDADAAARSADLVSFVFSRQRFGRLLDLAGGTGSNIRYLAPRLPMPQPWTIVDSDPQLLAHAPPGAAALCADLNVLVDDPGVFRGCALVTASALLDLVSNRWLTRLVEQCRAAEAAVLFALNYDGRIICDPPELEDEHVRGLVNEHQQTDKGFGPALGPAAATRVADLLASAQYDVRRAQSDWTLTARESDLQRQLIAGWAQAALAMDSRHAARIVEWRDRRIAHVDEGRSRMTVGHVDLAAVLPST